MSKCFGNDRGFTLVELMGSMAVGTIVLLTAAAFLGSSGEGFERVGGTVASEREARAVLSQIASELSTATFHEDTEFSNDQGSGPADLGFLSLQPPEAQLEKHHIGDICAVSYYLADRPVDGRQVRCLMRGFRPSNKTFDALEDNDISQLFTPPSSGPNNDEPLAFGVISFQALPKSRGENGVWIDWRRPGPDNATDTSGPDAVEVRLVVVRRQLAGRLRTSADWSKIASLDESDQARNPDLQVYRAMLRFGNNEQP